MDEKLVDDFKRLTENGVLSHAYLFFGDSEKKIMFANSLANFLENGLFEEPKNILKETLIISPDEKGIIGIDEIRNLRYYLWQKPVVSSRKIALIENAQSLTPEAQNAALKIVEEPPEAGLIIFIAKTSDDLLPTLNSRLQKVYFAPETLIDAGKKRIYADDGDEDNIEQSLENLIANLKIDPIKNSGKLKEALRRLTLIKQFNTNEKLQWRSLKEFL